MIALWARQKNKQHTRKNYFENLLKNLVLPIYANQNLFVVVDSLFAVLLLFVGGFVFSLYFVMLFLTLSFMNIHAKLHLL